MLLAEIVRPVHQIYHLPYQLGMLQQLEPEEPTAPDVEKDAPQERVGEDDVYVVYGGVDGSDSYGKSL